jgi:hypothetical protein
VHHVEHERAECHGLFDAEDPRGGAARVDGGAVRVHVGLHSRGAHPVECAQCLGRRRAVAGARRARVHLPSGRLAT